MTQSPPLPDRIRQAISAAHVAVEQTPFAQAMTSGRVSRAEYVAGLSQLAHLHAGLEATLLVALSKSAELAAVYRPETMARTPLIARDLAALGATVGDPVAEAVGPVARLEGEFREWAATTPHALIGALYVLEGSRMGSMVLARSLTKALRVEPRPGAGLDYHIEGIATRPGDWKRFKEALAGLAFTDGQQGEIVRAAVRTMDTLVTLYATVPVATPEPAVTPAAV